MQLKKFTYILQNPQHLSEEQYTGISEIVETHPYFQPARALYLKVLKDKGSFKYNQELKITAAHTTDRSVLFDYITSEQFKQNEISAQIKQNTEHLKDLTVEALDDVSVNKSVIIDDVLKRQIEETEGVLDPGLFEEKTDSPKEIISISPENSSTEKQEIHLKESPNEQLKIGSPLEFESTETHSFSEWLKITRFQPIKREEQENSAPTQDKAKPKKPLEDKLELIDKFLQSNPKIKPSKDKVATPSILQNKEPQQDGYMTETLARIYLEQGNYNKAIQSYKILSLKYPEKSGFFADQIKAIQKLQEQNK